MGAAYSKSIQQSSAAMADNPFTALPTSTPDTAAGISYKQDYAGVPSLLDEKSLPPGPDPVGDAIFAGIDDNISVQSIPPPAGFSGPSDATNAISDPTLQPPQSGSNVWSPDAQPQAFPGEAQTTPAASSEEKGALSSDIDPEAPFYKLDFWRKYFDVDTIDVVTRGIKASTPLTNAFNLSISNKPDMYGPLWICNTLIFACALCGNMASYFASSSDDVWQYDFEKLTLGAVMVYGYCTLVPLLLSLALHTLGEGLSLAYLLCLYGYVMLVWIPAAVLCTIPNELLRWVTVGAACGISGGALFGNLGPIVVSSVPARGTIICIVLGALHVGVALAFKLYFFEF